MKDKLYALISALLEFTKSSGIKWKEGTEPGEYYINFSGNGVLLSKEVSNIDTIYKLSLKGLESPSLATVKFDKSESPLFTKADELYNLITFNSESAGRTIDDILNEIKLRETEKNGKEWGNGDGPSFPTF